MTETSKIWTIRTIEAYTATYDFGEAVTAERAVEMLDTGKPVKILHLEGDGVIDYLEVSADDE